MNDDMEPTALNAVLARFDALLARVERLLPAPPAGPDWERCIAFRWRRAQGRGWLEGVTRPHRLRLRDLRCIDRQKALLERNIRQFVRGVPANNVLLWGSRGTGKSSLIKALLNEYAPQGLRLIEVDKHELIDLPEIVRALEGRSERFLIFCDDLSFEAEDSSYKALKATLDGSIAAPPDNVLLCATSNRRHLLPEYMRDNQASQVTAEGELHHGEAVEEKISLSERFGLWLSFHPFKQDEYLEVVAYWLDQLGHAGGLDEAARAEALRYALTRGSRSGRVAWQFARDWVGRHALEG